MLFYQYLYLFFFITINISEIITAKSSEAIREYHIPSVPKRAGRIKTAAT